MAPSDSPRLQSAEAAKRAADSAVVERAAERGCAANCRALLEQQVTASAVEVAAARAELAGKRAALEAEVAAARDAFAAMKLPISGTPLADRLGVAPWVIDLIGATLASLAVNGLAATLLAFAGHRPHAAPAAEAPVASPSPPQEPPRRRAETPREHAARFAVEALRPGAGPTPLREIYSAYLLWCAKHGVEPMSAPAIGEHLARLFGDAGLRTERGAVHGVEVRSERATLAIAALMSTA